MKKLIIIIIILVILFIGFKIFSKDSSTVKDSQSSNSTYTLNTLNSLKHTSNFLPSAIDHIFLGKIDSNGCAEGFHYANIKGANSHVIVSTKSNTNQYGVYKAKASIDGELKSDDGSYSTFFPNSLSPQEVIDYINDAYSNRRHLHNNIYIGTAPNGMEIEMYLTDDNKIISAFPKF
ncbi:MAG: EndoU domain-containing protein [Clostridium sp.]|uniref:EndoU domain-containing protein n=1 Tax=Clostridium sp. TaxID=1506 RepID=UPI003EE5C449